MKTKTLASCQRQLSQAMARLAKERDKVRELEDDIQALSQDTEEAYQLLVEASDALSRLV